jgi:hypothetical protein
VDICCLISIVKLLALARSYFIYASACWFAC